MQIPITQILHQWWLFALNNVSICNRFSVPHSSKKQNILSEKNVLGKKSGF